MKRTLILLALAACGSKGGDDWTAKPLVQQEGTKGTLTFTIKAPEGLPRDKRDAGNWSDARMEYDHTPKIFTSLFSADGIKTVDDAKKDILSAKDAEFVRAEQSPDGFAVTTVKGKHRIEAVTWKKVGDKYLKCTAVQVGDGDLPNFDKTRTMLEAMCDSIAPK